MSRFFGPLKPDWLNGRRRDGERNGRGTDPPPMNLFANAVYYPNYRVYREQPPSILNVSCISHVFYAFA